MNRFITLRYKIANTCFIFLCLFFVSVLVSCSAQEKSSTKTFKDIALLNRIEFNDTAFNQQKFSCGFLLKHKSDTFAVTAKHLIKVIKPEGMKTLQFSGVVKQWSMFPMGKKDEVVVTRSLLNESKKAQLDDKSIYENDWLVFSIKSNTSKIVPLSIRTKPLNPGEKVYVVGWTRKMEEGPQRVYEFEYYKTIGNRLLLKDVLVPELFGGLSGAPVVDEEGLLVGLVSGATSDPDTKKKYFSPCSIQSLLAFLNGKNL